MTPTIRNLTVSSAPAAEPVSTAEAKTHLRVDHSNDDTYIDTLVTSAREYVEHYTGRALITQTLVEKFDYSFPPAIILMRSPVQSITSISYTDDNGDAQTLSTDVYELNTGRDPSVVQLKYGQDWPTVRTHENAVTVTYVAGYGDASTDVPTPIIHAIKLLVSQWYENRESYVVGVSVSPLNKTVDALLGPYRVFRCEL